jgi:hypothetical protein
VVELQEMRLFCGQDPIHGKQRGGVGQALARETEDTMLLRWLLFETGVGETLLTFLERKVGLAIVQAEWLAVQPSGEPAAMGEVQ